MAALLIEQFRYARIKGTPIIAITTPDPGALVEAICAALTPQRDAPAPPMLQWDSATGIKALGNHSLDAHNLVFANVPAASLLKLDVALTHAVKLPAGSIVFVLNAHRFVRSSQPPQFTQAVANLRDVFKQDRRTLVLLGPSFELPSELEHDVITLDDPLPTPEQLSTLVTEEYVASRENAGSELPELEDKVRDRAVEALRGVSPFKAEQIFAINLRRTHLDIDGLWEHKHRVIEQQKGLSVNRAVIKIPRASGTGFDERPAMLDDVGSHGQLKTYMARLFSGPTPPKLIVLIDEFEKSMGGSGDEASGDNGIAQDEHSVLLRELEGRGYMGAVGLGAPGVGKTLLAGALGNEFGVPSICLDVVGTRGKYVGESGAAIRAAFRMILGIAGEGGALFIGLCNRMRRISPELRRRFRQGMWFFDGPTPVERVSIWEMQLRNYRLSADQERPNDDMYTGADIRNVCDTAWRLNTTLLEASTFIVPVWKSDPGVIDTVRETAHGRFLSTSYAGWYLKDRMEQTVAETKVPKRRRRAIGTED